MADLKTISENLRTQDNRITAEPIFLLQGLRRVCWVNPALDFWETVQPFFTEAGAKAYLEENGHNLRHYEDVRIYVESAFRNEEWQFVRALLMKGAADDV